MLTVHIRVQDEQGRALPVLLRICDDAGRYHPPLGRLARFATEPGVDVGGQVLLRREAFAAIPGSCEVRLPPGALTVEISRGPEFSPLVKHVQLAAGQMSLRFRLERWTDWEAQGWVAGDIRAHELSPHAAALEGAAVGLGVVQVLAREVPAEENLPGSIRGLLEFSGSEVALTSHGCEVVVNTLNSHPVLGTVALLNSHRPVFPLRSGRPGPDDWAVSDWCDQCHRKTGLVVWPDLPRLSEEQPQGEALAALILGKIDAFEVGPISDPQSPVLGDYHRLLNCGLRPVLVGGSGKESNAQVLGSMRTYAHLTQPQDAGESLRPLCSRWIDAVRAGRTFITTMPLISLSVAEQGPGSVISATKGTRLRLRAEAISVEPFEFLEILVNGEVQVSKTASGNQTAAIIETDLVCDGSAWVAAVCYAPARLRTGACVFAHTGPVWVDVPDAPLRPSADTVEPLLEVLANTRRWVETEAKAEPEKLRGQLLGVLDEARARLENARR